MAKEKKEKTRMTQRQKHLFWIIILGSFFEGLDDSLVNIALPYIGLTFGFAKKDLLTGIVTINEDFATILLAIIGIGTVVAFLMSRLADRIGRRPVFLWCVYGYSICTLLTAIVSMPFFVGSTSELGHTVGILGQNGGLYAFAFFQFVARIFLIGSWSVGYVILTEEFAAKDRGFATGRFQLAAVFGGLLVGILIMFFIPKTTIDGYGWQWLYMIGAIPMIPVFLLRKWLPETEAFLQRKQSLPAGVSPAKDASFMEVWKKPHRKYLIIMSVVWFFFYFGIKGQLNLFSTRVVADLSWAPSDITLAVATATIIGIFIIGINGKLLDILGRKKAALLIILVGVATSFATFMLEVKIPIIVVNVIATGCLNSYLMIGSTITNELFPTKVRASAMAWANNIFGRVGQIGVPIFVGILASTSYLGFSGAGLGWGNALAIAMLLPLISLFLLMVFVPETSKKSIAEIDGETAEAAKDSE